MATAKELTLVSDNQKKLIFEKTPQQFIKQRQGPGGTTLNYVETGYVIDQLNKIFNYLWDFEIIEQQIGQKQVWVRGKLTVHLSENLSISKTQYGGIDIKKKRDTGETVSIADDLKAASSDALKKCASLFGIASDVFWPAGEIERETTIDDFKKPITAKKEEKLQEEQKNDNICEVHGVAWKTYEKDGRSWESHKNADGTWHNKVSKEVKEAMAKTKKLLEKLPPNPKDDGEKVTF